MKINILFFISVLVTVNALGQTTTETPQIKNSLPEIAIPSPTVAALMKFEEVPVSNYTGIPDISIPLYSISSRSKDITLDIALKYHPSDIQIDNVASWAGTGWSLVSGGSIARVVKGAPDEVEIGNKGVYYNSFEDLFYTNGNYNPVITSETHAYNVNKFMWESYEKGKYDSQYDIYQFNFMGYSGKFYINKYGELIELYNDQAIKIIYNKPSDSFTVFDDKGYRYVFSVIEAVTDYKHTTNTRRDFSIVSPVSPAPVTYTSAYHLSDIFDKSGNLLIKYNYEHVGEVVDRQTTTFYTITNLVNVNNTIEKQCDKLRYYLGNLLSLLPFSSGTITTSSYSTQKLKNIDVIGKAKIEFVSEAGREDLNPEAVRIKSLYVKNLKNEVIKAYDFEHEYLGAGKRLVLKKLKERGHISDQPLVREFEYNDITLLPERNSRSKDAWGYFNNSQNLLQGGYNQTEADYCTVGVLQKMTLPTGGCLIFNFESNQYSYQGDNSLTEFDNLQNRIPKPRQNAYSGSASINAGQYHYFNIPADQTVNFNITTSGFSSNTQKKYWYFEFIPVETIPPSNGPLGPIELQWTNNYNIDTSRQEIEIRLEDIDASLNSSYYSSSINLKKGAYVVRFFANPNLPVPTVGGTYLLNYTYHTLTDTYKYVNGGGIRIANIGYFETSEIGKNYYKIIKGSIPYLPVKPKFEKKYNYNHFNEPLRSSGSLMFAKPVYEYKFTQNALMRCELHHSLRVEYWVVNNFNSLNPLKTQGGDVGYKNVTVTTNNWDFTEHQDIFPYYLAHSNEGTGRSEFTYTSPIDYPAGTYEITYPFTDLTKNLDYKRGLLQNERHFTLEGSLLKETEYDYNILEDFKVSGLRFGSPENCAYNEMYSTFEGYYSAYQNNSEYQCGYPSNIIAVSEVEQFGWSQLREKVSKEYFYNGNTLQGVVTTRDTMTYNPANKRIATHYTETYSAGSDIESIEKRYYYKNWTSNNNITAIDKIEVLKNGSITEAQRVHYTPAQQPSLIESAKVKDAVQLSFEPRVYFDSYDQYSNPLQVHQSGGTPISYIWGYNSTVPIAMIENCNYQSIPSNLVQAAKSASDSGDEAALLAALQALRDGLPFSMVTTYTYQPLVGMKTVTDPKGLRTTYSYDNFGRLKEVRDNEGKLLSENQYHYRTQQP